MHSLTYPSVRSARLPVSSLSRSPSFFPQSRSSSSSSPFTPSYSPNTRPFRFSIIPGVPLPVCRPPHHPLLRNFTSAASVFSSGGRETGGRKTTPPNSNREEILLSKKKAAKANSPENSETKTTKKKSTSLESSAASKKKPTSKSKDVGSSKKTAAAGKSTEEADTGSVHNERAKKQEEKKKKKTETVPKSTRTKKETKGKDAEKLTSREKKKETSRKRSDSSTKLLLNKSKEEVESRLATVASPKEFTSPLSQNTASEDDSRWKQKKVIDRQKFQAQVLEAKEALLEPPPSPPEENFDSYSIPRWAKPYTQKTRNKENIAPGRVILHDPEKAREILKGWGFHNLKKEVTVIHFSPGIGVLSRALLELPNVRKVIGVESHPQLVQELANLRGPRFHLEWDHVLNPELLSKPEVIASLEGVQKRTWDDPEEADVCAIVELPTDLNSGLRHMGYWAQICQPDTWLYAYGRVRWFFITPEIVAKRALAKPGSQERQTFAISLDLGGDLKQTMGPESFIPNYKYFIRGPRVPEEWHALQYIPRKDSLFAKWGRDSALDFHALARDMCVRVASSWKSSLKSVIPGIENVIKIMERDGYNIPDSTIVRDLTSEDWRAIYDSYRKWPFRPASLEDFGHSARWDAIRSSRGPSANFPKQAARPIPPPPPPSFSSELVDFDGQLEDPTNLGDFDQDTLRDVEDDEPSTF